MYDSHLLEVIKVFPEKELAEIRLFIQSPFFNRHPRPDIIVALFDRICQGFPLFNSPELARTAVYTGLFPGQEVIEGKLDKIMSELVKLIRAFVVYRDSQIEEGSHLYQLKLAAFYRNHKFESRFFSITNKLRQQIENEKKEVAAYHHLFKLEEQLHDYLIMYYPRKADTNLVETIKALDAYYFSERLILTGSLLNIRSQSEFDPDYVMKSIYIVGELLEKGHFQDNILISAYYNGAMMIYREYRDCDHQFWELMDFVELYQDKLPFEHLRNLGAMCRNYCTRQINYGNEDYFKVQVNLFKQHLKMGILYHQGGILASTLQNLVLTGLKVKDYDWVKDILEIHRHRITGTNHPEQIYRFNLANYYFHIREFDKALDLLADHYDEIWHNMRARCLEIKIYFEKNELLLMESKLEAFRINVLRLSKKYLNDNTRTSYLNFVNLSRKLISPLSTGNKKRAQKLLEEARSLPGLVDREWFLEKLGS